MSDNKDKPQVHHQTREGEIKPYPMSTEYRVVNGMAVPTVDRKQPKKRGK